jgi:hypothetical protein
MIRPDPRTTKAIAHSVMQHPEILEWLQAWKAQELERLPFTTTNTALFQGRCQVLDEVVDFVKQAPALAAKL